MKLLGQHARMRWFAAVALLVSAMVELSCASTSPPDAGQWARLAESQAAIYVRDRYKGLTPAELRVRRGLGETTVTLRRSEETVRRFNIEVPRLSGSFLPYLSGVETDGGVPVFDIEDLEREADSTYTIPNLGIEIKVYDRRYGFTLWVVD